MIPRYAHPDVTELWSPQWTYSTWLNVESTVLFRQLDQALVPKTPETEQLSLWLRTNGHNLLDLRALNEIAELEKTTKHDVVAFLTWLRSKALDDSGRWLHFGLTSSDLVDTTQGLRFRALHKELTRALDKLDEALARWLADRRVALGRTHGQPAEPVGVFTRARHWQANLDTATEALLRHTLDLGVAKLSGPVGTFAHNPPDLEAAVALDLGLWPVGPGASQVAPRADLALWASAAAALAASCNKVAVDLRLLNLTGEVTWRQTEGQVGSSSMPHKNNPIVAEQVTGLSRLVAGYAQALQPLDLWLERDLSSSCVERVAVPDLWHVLLRLLEQTAWLLEHAELTFQRTEVLERWANEAWTHRETLDWIRDGYSFVQSRDAGETVQVESYDLQGDAKWFTRNYPEAPSVEV